MRDEDTVFGAAAVDAGLITVVELIEALRELWTMSAGGERLWQVLVRRRLVDLDQVNALQRQMDQTPAERAAFLPQPERRYETEKTLGVGGMGIVRQVRDRALGRSVAMKQLLPEVGLDDEAIGTLVAEARVAGMLEHPNIMPVYDVGLRPGGHPYYTMRLMDVLSLADVLGMLRQGNPEVIREYPLPKLLRIFLQVCQAVDYAHGRGVIHRDIKPDNVRLGRHGEVQLADWGLAQVDGMPDLPLRKALREAHERGEIEPCIVIGSPNYMSPEQACGRNEELTPASDIYALGAMLYEMLTLAAPFEDVDTMVLLDKVERDPVVAPVDRAPERVVPTALSDLCMQTLEKDPNHRVPDVRLVIRKVEEYLQGHRDQQATNGRAFEQVQRGHRYGRAYLRLREGFYKLRTRVERTETREHRRTLRRDAKALQLEMVTAWAEAYDAYTRADGLRPDDIVTRAKLAELAWYRLEDAEQSGDEVGCHFFWRLLERYNDGAWNTYLVGDATLHVVSAPRGAVVHLRRFGRSVGLEDDVSAGRAVGRTPVRAAELQAGLYLVTVDAVGHRAVARPVFLRAGAERTLRIDLR